MRRYEFTINDPFPQILCETVVALVSVLLLTLALIPTPPIQAGGPTYVGGIISSDTTWTLANSPYVVNKNILVSLGFSKKIIIPRCSRRIAKSGEFRGSGLGFGNPSRAGWDNLNSGTPLGVTLTIEPGTIVSYTGAYFIQVDGTLVARGD